jgi:hypothetical protein
MERYRCLLPSKVRILLLYTMYNYLLLLTTITTSTNTTTTYYILLSILLLLHTIHYYLLLYTIYYYILTLYIDYYFMLFYTVLGALQYGHSEGADRPPAESRVRAAVSTAGMCRCYYILYTTIYYCYSGTCCSRHNRWVSEYPHRIT